MKLCIFLGSGIYFNKYVGGHTTEMLQLLNAIEIEDFSEIIYLYGEGDDLSRRKIEKKEHSMPNVNIKNKIRKFTKFLEAEMFIRVGFLQSFLPSKPSLNHLLC